MLTIVGSCRRRWGPAGRRKSAFLVGWLSLKRVRRYAACRPVDSKRHDESGEQALARVAFARERATLERGSCRESAIPVEPRRSPERSNGALNVPRPDGLAGQCSTTVVDQMLALLGGGRRPTG